MTTPADELRTAAARLDVAVRIHPDIVKAFADLLAAVANDPDDPSLNEPGSARHGGCDRTTCPAVAALAVARAINALENKEIST